MFKEKDVLQNLADYKIGWAQRGFEFDEQKFLLITNEKRDKRIQLESLQATKNKLAKFSGAPTPEQLLEAREKSAAIEGQMNTLNEQVSTLEKSIEGILLMLPAIPVTKVVGREEDAKEILSWGTKPTFEQPPLAHDELTAQLDTGTGALLAQSRFSVLRADIALLHRALINYMLDEHLKNGYELVNVPLLVNAQTMQGTGQLPKFKEDLFFLEKDNLYLIPTAEVPVTNMLANQLLTDKEVDYRFVCHTPCFRREAGSAGKDTRGIIRQHQFEKVELVRVVEPAQAPAVLEELTGHAEAILQGLGLAYRKIELATGDLGFASTKTYDLEVWLPSQDKYREISSVSLFGDFQAKRMNLRVKRDGKTFYPYTLNGSGLAVGRCLAAVLENYQRPDKTLTVPEALRPYLGGKEVLSLGNAPKPGADLNKQKMKK